MFKQDSKIYIAGHNGLLGSAIFRKLKAKGYGNIVTRSRAEMDLTDRSAVSGFFIKEKPDFVFLAAGLTGGISANKTRPATFLHTNIAIQDNCFQAAQDSGVRNIIFYGSSCVYPKLSPQPIKEEYLLTGKLEDTSEGYAVAKIAGITACKAYNSQYKTGRFIALIPNSIYGPNDNFDPDNSHVLSALIRRFYEVRRESRDEVVLWGSGEPRREFVFSDDAADASVFAMVNAENLENSHYNIGTGKDHSIKELAGLIAGITGFKGRIVWDKSKPDGSPRKILDSGRFLKLGWKPMTSLEDGLKVTCDWYLENNPGS